MSAGFSEDYYSSLCDLTSNRRPLIDMLTMLAEDNIASAPSIVTTIETHLTRVAKKLPTLYLIDSIVKNIGREYIPLFAQNLPTLFTMVFSQADALTRSSMFKLRNTWDGIFPPEKLYLLDTYVHDKDPEWPVVSSLQPTNIHINPEFIKGGVGRRLGVKEDLMKERILKEKKILLELQKKKVELEILQTQEVLEKEQKKLESYTITREAKPPQVPDFRNLQSSVREVSDDKSKKLLELSMRDPRRKSRQTEVASSSPLSGTSSPIPSKPIKQSELLSSSSSSSPYVDFSDDSRDCPPNKKSKSSKKEEKSSKSKGSSKNKGGYEPKSSIESKNSNNGLSYKPSGIDIQEYEDMETLEQSKVTPSSQSRERVPEAQEKSVSEQISTEALAAIGNKEVKNISEMPVSSSLSDNNEPSKPVRPDFDLQSIESNSVDLFESGKPTITVRTRDPRLLSSSSKSSSVDTESDIKLPPSLVSSHSQPVSELGASSKSVDSSEVSSLPTIDQNSDLISNVSKSKPTEKKLDLEKIDSPPAVGTNFESSEVRSIDSNALFEELKNSDEDSGSDFSSKNISSKRKFDPEDDEENHKKLLLSQVSDNDDFTGAQSLDILSSNKSSDKAENKDSATEGASTPPLVAPPPPIISTCSSTSDSTQDPTSKVSDSEVLSTPSLVSSEETGKDIDLRLLLPRPIEIIKEEEVFPEVEPITLFGGEDVDYRQKPPLAVDFNPPSPPPPPVISNIKKGPGKDSWAQIKDRPSEERFPSPSIKKIDDKYRSPKMKPEKGRRSSQSQSKSNASSRESSHQNSQERCNFLIKDAEEQFKNGTITFVEYNKMLKEVVNINEERILDEARARYSSTPVTPDEVEPVSPDTVEEPFESRKPIQPPPETRKISINLKTKVLEPQSDNQSQENSRKRRKNQSADKRAMDSSESQSDLLLKSDNVRERNDYPGRRVWNDKNEPPVSNMNFPTPRGMPIPQFPVFPPSNLQFPPFRPMRPSDITCPTFLPPVDRDLLYEAENNRTENINIGGNSMQIRFYGLTAIAFLSWDDPREVRFLPEKKKLIVDNRHEFILQFGDCPTEIMIDGMSSIVQLGAPGREIYIDNKYYSMNFGGLSIEVLICGRVRSISLSGPTPVVSFGPIKRIDLVAGFVNLYINAKNSAIFFLDATPQKFYIGTEPCVLQFADSLMTILINGVPVPLEFDKIPVPVSLRGVLYFLRMVCLPTGIVPGQINIVNMMCFAHPPPTVPPMQIPVLDNPPFPSLPSVPLPPALLTNSDSGPAVPSSSLDRSYTVEQPPVISQPENTKPTLPVTDSCANLDIKDLFQKLVQTGILNNLPVDPPEEKTKKNPVIIEEIDADFSKPESLKCARPSLVTKLYSGIQCSTCGIRFPPEGTKMYSRHLDWHFRQNRREMHSTRKPQSRNWYYSYPNWLQYQELDDIDENEPDNAEEEVDDESEEDIPSVPVGRRKNIACQVCSETFEEFFDHETEEWQARNAILKEDLFYHPLCYEEFKDKKEAAENNSTEVKLELGEEEEMTLPLEEDVSAVEVIDLDDTEVPSPVSSEEGETLPLLGPEKEELPDVIAVDDTSDDKSSTNEVKTEDIKANEEVSDDDDILDIIPIERKIESYDLVDDDEDDKPQDIGETINLDDTKLDSTSESKEEEFDFTKVTIKQEKDRVVPENVDSSLPTYTATIDGNIVHDSAVQPILPTGRIKINIHRSKQNEDIEPSTDSNDEITLLQPLPPGEDIILPDSVKPKLRDVPLTPQPPRNQGCELSGLCSIM